MERKKFQVVCDVIGVVLFISNFCFAAYSGGSGTSTDPYLITTAADVNELSKTSGDWASGKYFQMTNDINLPTDVNYITPIGNSTTMFAGTFDGNGYAIRNLHLIGFTHQGLFGVNDGFIKNLGIEACDVNGVQFVGSLAGSNMGSISNCYSANSTIIGCRRHYPRAPNSLCIGGLVGSNSGYGIISNCYSTGSVFVGSDSGSSCLAVGGLAGVNYSFISRCYSIGTVSDSGNSHFVGGFVGINYGSLSSCYATGSVSGHSLVGGLVGLNVDGEGSDYSAPGVVGGSIENCYSTGAVSGGSCVGGLCGGNGYVYFFPSDGGPIRNCYSTGSVSGTSEVGGLCGHNDGIGSFTSCYFLGTAGVDNGFGEPLTDEQMKQQESFVGWDFVDETANGSDDIWRMYFDGNGYPRMAWNTRYSGGSGTVENPYLIATAADVNELSRTSGDWASGKYFQMTNDINLPTDVNYITPIGNSTTMFAGTFDGNGYAIRNLHLKGFTHQGLFGRNDGFIKNLGIEACDVNGVQLVGSLAGSNKGSISNCYSANSTITSCRRHYPRTPNSQCIGGLVGSNSGYGTISNCYSTSSVFVGGDREPPCLAVGGLAGANYSFISRCYSTGTVSDSGGSSFVGGFVGVNHGSLSSCYATGSVSGSSSVGGLVGVNDGERSDYSTPGVVSGSIENCYGTGAVSGGFCVGGLCGGNGYIFASGVGGPIRNCYSTGSVSGEDYIGGLCGCNDSIGSFTSCYFLDTAGPNNGLGEPLTNEQMEQQASYIDWDFSYSDGNDAVWFMAFEGYPILPWQISPADIYTDGKNNFKDWTVFAKYWMREDCRMYNDFCEFSDMDFDGNVDIDDLAEFISYWLEEGIY